MGDDESAPRRGARKAKERVKKGVSKVRDRRTRVRRRLEEIFDRETVMSVGVMGSMGKLMETSLVPYLDPASTVPVGRVLAWAIVFVLMVVVSVYWERLARAASEAADSAKEAADTAKEAVDGDGE